jgi:hypothetical protein
MGRFILFLSAIAAKEEAATRVMSISRNSQPIFHSPVTTVAAMPRTALNPSQQKHR